ncbi:DUF4136 domain-containing protein [Tunicatimonas pelagia]|uniref:DUF4136 domain-containing protein n=1 Tax=Tunicatimonas pelagia TaxID=931531 RepID=UPI002665EBDC|nr:DUF4136 domain-containing protein [Tunicatimonas pelagia]WKN45101.1 DUF4136 domain-containing protein [Tunicatimonas pelagia]
MIYRYILSILIISSIACSSIKTYTEAPADQKVSHYKTFAFVSPDESEMDQASLILYDEIRKSIVAQLREKNYQPNTENPELLIAFNIMTDEEQTAVTRSTDPYGAYGRRMWAYNPYALGWVPPQTYREIRIEKTGTMVVDLFDNQAKELIWRGIGIGPVNNPEERFETAYKMVDKIFKGFPTSTDGAVSVAN